MSDSAKAPVSVSFETAGVEEVRRGIRLVRDDAEELGEHGGGMGEKFAMATRHMAAGLEEVAHTGEIAGRGMKELIVTGAEMASSFGIGGPIVGAIGILGLAFVDHFNRAREEIEKTRVDAITALEDISRQGDLIASARRQGEIRGGDQYAIRKPNESDAEFIARSGGLLGIRARIEQLRASLPKEIVDRGGLGTSFLGSSDWTADMVKGGRELRELLGLLAEYKRNLAEIEPITARLMKEEGERARIALELARDKAALQVLPEVPGLNDTQFQRLREGVPLIGKVGDAFQSLRGQLAGEADVLMREFYAGTTSAERRLEIETKLAEILKQQAEIAPKTSGINPNVKGTDRDIFNTPDVQKNVAKMLTYFKPLGELIADNLGDIIGNSIGAGFEKGLAGGGLTNGFAAMRDGLLAGMGSLFEQAGESALAGLTFMDAIKSAIMSWNPAIGIPAAIGLIALGAEMKNLASSAASTARGVNTGTGYSGLPQIIDRGYINPSAATRGANVSPVQPVTVNATIIGTDDVRAQRQIVELVDKGLQRGGIRYANWNTRQR